MGKGQRSACGRGTQYEVSGRRPHVHLVACAGPARTRVTRCRRARVWQKQEQSVLSVLSVCLSVCVSPSCQRYETTRASTVDHRECPAIKPPTFCLLLRALDRGRPPGRWIGRSQAIGGSEGRFGPRQKHSSGSRSCCRLSSRKL